jgi:hypothetical protein
MDSSSAECGKRFAAPKSAPTQYFKGYRPAAHESESADGISRDGLRARREAYCARRGESQCANMLLAVPFDRTRLKAMWSVKMRTLETPFAGIFGPKHDEESFDLLMLNFLPLHAGLTSTGKRAAAWRMMLNRSPSAP